MSIKIHKKDNAKETAILVTDLKRNVEEQRLYKEVIECVREGMRRLRRYWTRNGRRTSVRSKRK